MKYKSRRIITIALILIISLLFFTAPVLASHTSPVTGMQCNNTNTFLRHGSMFDPNGTSTTHVITVGQNQLTCIRTVQVHNHSRVCTGCGLLLASNAVILHCRRIHSRPQCATENLLPNQCRN
jgi:hypothetical protein